jgi:hypothetical protein
MRTKVDALQLGAWMFVGKSRSIPLTVFRMDDHSYRTLVDWTRAKTGRDDEHATAVLRGLHEIISLFVPDTLFVAVGRSGLEITFSGVDLKDEGRRGRVRFALSTWLGVIYPDPGHRPAQRAHVADSALKADNWRVVEASTTLRGRGPHVCDAPEDTGLWNAVAARCVSALAGATVVFPSGRSKRLVPTVPTAGYDGIELIAFPPNQSVEKPGGYWTEVLTIDCASFPVSPRGLTPCRREAWV